jgi:hypothetical protein
VEIFKCAKTLLFLEELNILKEGKKLESVSFLLR